MGEQANKIGKILCQDCKLCDELLKDWIKLQIPARAQNSLPRTETLWLNYEPLRQISLF